MNSVIYSKITNSFSLFYNYNFNNYINLTSFFIQNVLDYHLEKVTKLKIYKKEYKKWA
jgi:hypothetical protein